MTPTLLDQPDVQTPHEAPDGHAPEHASPADLAFATLLALVVVATAFGFAPLPPI